MNQFSICRSSISDGPQFDASFPTQSPFGHPKKSPGYKSHCRFGTRKLPHICLPRDSLYGCDSLPEPVNHKAEDRFKSLCQRIQGFVKIERLRIRFWALWGHGTWRSWADGHDGSALWYDGFWTPTRPPSSIIGPINCGHVVP